LRKTLLNFFICFTAITGNAIAGWSIPALISERAGGNYPQIIVQDSVLHVIYENEVQYDKICYLKSNNMGETWRRNFVLSENNGPTVHPRIIRWRNRLLALWRADLNGDPSPLNIGYAISIDNGDTWSLPNFVFEDGWRSLISYTVSSYDSLISIVLFSQQGPDNAFYIVRSSDFGATWSDSQRLFSAVESGIPDQAGTNEITYFTWDGRFELTVPWEIRFIKSSDGGINWSENIVLSDSDEFHSEHPAVACDSTKVICTWMDFKYSPYGITGDIFFRISFDSGDTWSEEQQVTSNHRATKSDVEIMGDTIVITWEDSRPENGSNSIYSIRSSNDGLTWSDHVWIDGDSFNSHDPSLGVGNGRSYIIWYDWIYPDSAGLYFSRWDPEPDAIVDDISIPTSLALSAYPNPFNSATTISISDNQPAEIEIYDITGRLITTLHTVGGQALWDASAYSSGLYFARLAGEKAGTIKLILLK
jgi:hypothetical protein